MKPLTNPAQASWPVVVNENFDALAGSRFAYDYSTTTGLTLGYFGGHVEGTPVAGATIALDASNTVYVVIHRTTGVVSKATTTTNWLDVGVYGRLFLATTSGSAITDLEDWRDQPGGIFDQGGSAGLATDTLWDAAGDLVVGSGSNTAAKLPIGTARQKLRVNSGATAPEWVADLQCIAIACSDETTALTTGTGKAWFVNPYPTAFNIAHVVASLTTPQASGSIFTVDINEGSSPTSILSTKLTIDNTEYTGGSEAGAGSATVAVISDASIAAYGLVSVDIDQIGNGTAKGLKVYLLGTPST